MLIIQTYLKEWKYLLSYLLTSISLTTIVIYTYNYEILYIISKPIFYNDNDIINKNFDFIFTNIFEAFKTYLTLSIFLGLHFNLPFITWIALLFFIKGFYKSEIKIILLIITLFTIFMISVNIIFYYIIYPIIISFLTQYETINTFLPLNINMQLKLNEYLSIFLKLIYIYNISLTLPWLLLFYKNDNWVYYKKFIYLALIIIIAFITPPDIFSLILFLIPIFFILELAHFLKKIKY